MRRSLGAVQQDFSLRLSLKPEPDLAGEGVTLQFDGVAQLELRQVDEWGVYFDYLVCLDRGCGRRKRYRVQDPSGETVGFLCDSFRELPAVEREAS